MQYVIEAVIAIAVSVPVSALTVIVRFRRMHTLACRNGR